MNPHLSGVSAFVLNHYALVLILLTTVYIYQGADVSNQLTQDLVIELRVETSFIHNYLHISCKWLKL